MNAWPEMRLMDLRRVVAEGSVCQGLEDPDVMFPHPRWDPSGLAEAREVCAGCGVRSYCLELARRRGEQYGVWGGQLFTDEGEQPLGAELEAAS